MTDVDPKETEGKQEIEDEDLEAVAGGYQVEIIGQNPEGGSIGT